MAQFNTNAYYLKPTRDVLQGINPDTRPEQVIQSKMPKRRPPAQRRTLNGAHNTALAGTRVRGGVRGGKFAPRAVSGMS